jgi:hypothetical protein
MVDLIHQRSFSAQVDTSALSELQSQDPIFFPSLEQPISIGQLLSISAVKETTVIIVLFKSRTTAWKENICLDLVQRQQQTVSRALEAICAPHQQVNQFKQDQSHLSLAQRALTVLPDPRAQPAQEPEPLFAHKHAQKDTIAQQRHQH